MKHAFPRFKPIKKRSFAFNTIIMMSANAVARVLGFAYRIFASRLIGAEGMGLFGLIIPVYSICSTVIATGLPTAAMKLISEKKALKSPQDTANVMRASLIIVAVVSFVMALAVFLFSDKLSLLVGDARARLPLMVLCAAILITGFENIYKSYFYASEKVHIPAGAEIFEQIARTLFVVGVLLYTRSENIVFSISVMVAGMFVGEAVSSVFLKAAYKKHGVPFKSRKGLSSAAGGVASIAAPITATKIITTLIQSATTVIIPMRLVKYGMDFSSSLALFGVLNGMIMPLLFLPFTLTNALCVNLVPAISSCMVLGKTDAVRRQLSKTMYVTAFFVFPCVALLSSIAVPLGNILYAEPLVGAYLPIMAVGSIFQTYQHIFSGVLNAAGGEKSAAVIFAAGSCIQLVFTYILTPVVGIYGYIAGYLVSSVFICIADYVIIHKIIYLTPKVFSWFIKPLLSCLFSYFISRLVYLRIETVQTEAFSLVCACGVFALSYLFAVLIQIDFGI